ncbi:MAG: bacillithiol biosynthesis cysteine-adding enzyme BshC [Bryobacteraceae bacterium]|nr:bacillithiol biosynthesis cysteine-adding enzyme BshC [Bryobacteraceae bacterium]MDW8377250.1 bacillithiol biosynthesis cysteine-adding enzyme BshC [Bryobacterales bacterium]
MEIVCKRHIELPHTSKLFADLLYHFDRVAGLYAHDPHEPQSYWQAARQIDFPAERRRALVDVLEKQNGASESVRRLAREGTFVVATGQQTGLFSGPAYSIYKALTAVRLAEQLTAQGLEAVPVFWLATEDHDFAEVSACWSFDVNHTPVLLRLPAEALSDRPVGEIALREVPIKKLEESLAGFPYAEEVLRLARAAYCPGRTLGEAFQQLLSALLKPYDLLFFDPMQPEARRLAAPILKQAVSAAPLLTQALLERNRELQKAGYHAQVHMDEHTSLFFLLEDGRRLNLRRKNGEYFHKDRRWTSQQLMDRAETLSPNATLRPVVQDYIFPTVAYVGGPAELAYLAQSEVIYRQLLGRMPVATSRHAFTLIDPRSRKLMQRYGLGLESFFEGEEPLRERIATRLTPPEVAHALESTQQSVRSALENLRRSVASFDQTLGEALDRSARKIQYQLTKLQRKVARESLRRSQRAMEESAYLFQGIYPHKHLQERYYTILPFLARHGLDLVERLYEHLHPNCVDHHVLYL